MFEHDQYLNFAIFLLNSTPFQEVAKLIKINFFLKKVLRPILKTTALFHFSPCYQKLLERLFMIKLKSLWVKTNFCTDFSRIFEKTTLLTFFLDISPIKYCRIWKGLFHWNGYKKRLIPMTTIYKKRLIPLTTKFYFIFHFSKENEIFRLF